MPRVEAESDRLDRVTGCLLGLALGDARGAPFVARRRRDVPNPLPAIEALPHGTTAVTARAMHLAESLADRGGVDADDLVSRLLDLITADPPGVDGLTARVLRGVVADRQSGASLGSLATRAATAEWERRGPEVSAGNGPVASCPPLGCAYANRQAELPGAAATVTRLTHRDPRCATAVTAVALAVAALIRGESPEPAVAVALEEVIGDPGGEELEFLVGAVGDSRSVDGPDRTFVLYAAAAGLQAVARAPSFTVGVLRTVQLGGDTAANAAVAGALLGARVGERGLPLAWLDALDERSDVKHAGGRLASID